MEKLISIYWRDIPAQVVGRAGRKSNIKKELAPRFAGLESEFDDEDLEAVVKAGGNIREKT